VRPEGGGWVLSARGCCRSCLGRSKLESKGRHQAGLACVCVPMRVYVFTYTAIELAICLASCHTVPTVPTGFQFIAIHSRFHALWVWRLWLPLVQSSLSGDFSSSSAGILCSTGLCPLPPIFPSWHLPSSGLLPTAAQ